MKFRLIALIAILSFVKEDAFAQNSQISWAHGAGPNLLTSFHASERDGVIIAGDEARPYWICTLPPASVTWPVNDSKGGSQCTSLDRHDSELLIAGVNIYSFNLFTRDYSPIINVNNIIRYISATLNGDLLAFETDNDEVLHLYDRTEGTIVATWPNCLSPSAFSPDGKLLVTGFKDTDQEHGLAVIDVATHKVLHRYSMRILQTEAYEIVFAIKFNPQNPAVFAVLDDYGVLEMDTSGAILASWPVATSVGNDVIDYSPDGSAIAVATDGDIMIFHPSDRSSTSLPGGAQYLAFFGNDTIVATNGLDVYFFSIKQQKFLGLLNESDIYLDALAYSKDGTKLFDGYNLWDSETGNLLMTYPKGPASWQFAATSDLSRFVATRGDGRAYIWNSISDSIHLIAGSGIQSDTDFGRGLVAFSPNDSMFAAGGCITDGIGNPVLDSRNILKLWCAFNDSLICNFEAPAYPASSPSFSHDGSMLVGMVNEACYLWDVKTGKQIKTLGNNISPQKETPVNVTFLPGDSTVLIGCDSGWYMNQAVGFAIDRIRDDSFYFVPVPLPKFDGTISLFPDGRHFTIREHYDTIFNVIDLTDGSVKTRYVNNGEILSALAINPITGQIATGGYNNSDGSLIVWDYPFGADAVNEPPVPSSESLQAFASNRRITVFVPAGNRELDGGKVFVYRSDGRCCFSGSVESSQSSITTGVLPAGDYFIVLKREHGEPAFTKVSLF